MSKSELLNLVSYYWKERGCIDGYTGDDKVVVEFPEIGKAFKKYRRAMKRIDRALKEARELEE